jgi:hypothetical protein
MQELKYVNLNGHWLEFGNQTDAMTFAVNIRNAKLITRDYNCKNENGDYPVVAKESKISVHTDLPDYL